MSEIRRNLGGVTAYAYARSKGYTGTEEEFAQLMANYATVGETATEAAEQATTKAGEASTSATNAATSASAASASATAAASSASAAATSETNAAASEGLASSSATAAANSASVAQAAQTAAERVAESIPEDYSELSASVVSLDGKFQSGAYEYSSYVQGRRDASGNLIADTTRVTTGEVLKLHKNDTITVRGIASGQKYAIAGSGYDSGWKTADFTYTATSDAELFVNFATSSGSTAILPSEINAVITVTDNSSAVAVNRDDISNLDAELSAANSGFESYDHDLFTYGQYEDGVPGTFYKNRIRFVEIQSASKKIVITSLDSNITFSVALYDGIGTFQYQSAYQGKFVVESGKKYAVTIRDETKTDYNVYADIDALRTKVGIYTPLGLDLNNVKSGSFSMSFDNVQLENGSINTNGTDTTDEYNAARKKRTVDYFAVPSGAIVRNTNSDYRIGVIRYNSNHVCKGSSGWLAGETYTVPENCLIRITYGLKNDSILPEYIQPTIASNITVEYTAKTIMESVINTDESLKPDSGAYTYTGQPINLWKKSYNIEKLWNFSNTTAEGSYSKQASGYYGGVVFKLFANDLIQLYDFNTGTLLNEFAITSEHGQTIEFSNEFYDPNDEFPLAYISSEYRNDCAVYVNRITRTGATLIRTLVFPRQTVGLGSQAILDTMNNSLYKIGWKSDTDYQTPADGNCMIVTKWDLNVLNDNGDGTYTPDFIKTFETAFIDTLQGNVVFDGRAYIVSSNPYTPKTKVYVMDLGAGEYTNILTEFTEPIRDHEAEGIFFVPDGEKYAMIIDVQGTGLYKITF